MGKRITARHVVPAALLVLGFAACGRKEPEPKREGQGVQGTHEVHGAAGMQMDSAMMRRHMQEADTMMARVRADVAQMRSLSPDQWPAHMPEHLAVVDSMLAMMQRHMSECGGMQHQQMGAGTCMDSAMQQHMMTEMQALRTDVDALRNSSPAEVRERMPAHLDRLERMLQMMQEMHAGHKGM